MTDNKETKQAPAVDAGARDELLQKCGYEVFERETHIGRAFDFTFPGKSGMQNSQYKTRKDAETAMRERFNADVAMARTLLARASEATAGEPVAWQSLEDTNYVTADRSLMKQWERSGFRIRTLYAAPQPASEQQDEQEAKARAFDTVNQFAQTKGYRDGIHAIQAAPSNSASEQQAAGEPNLAALSEVFREAILRDDRYAMGLVCALASLAKDVAASQPARASEATAGEPDRYCVTAPDGSCISDDVRCMHAPQPASEQQAARDISDAAILACAFMINAICLTRPQDTWLKAIEARIRHMLAAKGDGHAD